MTTKSKLIWIWLGMCLGCTICFDFKDNVLIYRPGFFQAMVIAFVGLAALTIPEE